jgi:predicted HTH transcriptional regulator
MPDPKNPNDVQIDMMVKAAILKDDPPEKWIITKVKRKKTNESYCPYGTPIIFSDNRFGYTKGFVETVVELNENEIKNLIENHENLLVELKSSFQYSVKKSRQAECLKEQIVREISAMMNTKGGKVIIGVDNQKKILGLDDDYKFIKISKSGQPKKDSFIQELRDYVNSRLGHKSLEDKYNAYVANVDSKEICIIDVDESKMYPAFVLEKFKMRKCDDEETDSLTNGKRWTFYTKTDRGTSEKNPYEASIFWEENKQSQFLKSY